MSAEVSAFLNTLDPKWLTALESINYLVDNSTERMRQFPDGVVKLRKKDGDWTLSVEPQEANVFHNHRWQRSQSQHVRKEIVDSMARVKPKLDSQGLGIQELYAVRNAIENGLRSASSKA